MEPGVRKLHGSGKPALKHSGVCEEEQGMPSQSTKSGTPSFSGGRHAGRQQGLHRQDQYGSGTQGVHATAPFPVGHQISDVIPTAPAAAWGSSAEQDATSAATHSAGQSLAEAWECAWECRGRIRGCGGLREGRC